MDRITFSQAVDGYLLYAHSRRLSKHTVADYRNTFRRFSEFLAPEDPSISEIKLATLRHSSPMVIESAEFSELFPEIQTNPHSQAVEHWGWRVPFVEMW